MVCVECFVQICFKGTASFSDHKEKLNQAHVEVTG